MEDYIEMENKYLAPTYGNRGLVFNKGRGVYLYDNTGKRYLDCFSNVGVNILGHCNPSLNEAITEQLQKMTNLHGSFSNEKRAEFSKRLVEISPGLKRVYYCNSGAETIEA
ncbi:aminotransferase class III-fold pyridoxal phosphate-dependent enzyme, partial [Candidatus Woesearchaeota archaeon]|nr:aminotransferase class III-fold pyridoxal phosphate-dependent enzyme [Candidatus Woesearchaeota archaeon]